MKSSLSFLVALVALLSLAGCSGSAKTGVIQADNLAKNDPNAKAGQLLAEFQSQEPSEREGWVRNNAFAWSVFEQVTDSNLKSQFEREVKPLLNPSKP